MSKSPLRCYLETRGITAEAFAGAHALSAWSVRHWVRGNKAPSLTSQLAIERATDGVVPPAAWLAWNLARQAEAA